MNTNNTLNARFQHNDQEYLLWYDSAFEQLEENESLEIDSVKARQITGEAFVDWLNDLIGTSLTYTSMYFPREYNFEDDQVNISFSLEDFEKVKSFISENEMTESLNEMVEDVSTSRSGYAAFYSSDEIFKSKSKIMGLCLSVISNSLDLDGDFQNYFEDNSLSEKLYNECCEYGET